MWAWFLATWFSGGLVVLGGSLDLIPKAFSNINDSMILWFYDMGQTTREQFSCIGYAVAAAAHWQYVPRVN